MARNFPSGDTAAMDTAGRSDRGWAGGVPGAVTVTYGPPPHCDVLKAPVRSTSGIAGPIDPFRAAADSAPHRDHDCCCWST